MHLERIHMKLNKLIKKINKENAPPNGWKVADKIDPFGFNKAINWDKLNDPKVLKELEELVGDSDDEGNIAVITEERIKENEEKD